MRSSGVSPLWASHLDFHWLHPPSEGKHSPGGDKDVLTLKSIYLLRIDMYLKQRPLPEKPCPPGLTLYPWGLRQPWCLLLIWNVNSSVLAQIVNVPFTIFQAGLGVIIHTGLLVPGFDNPASPELACVLGPPHDPSTQQWYHTCPVTLAFWGRLHEAAMGREEVVGIRAFCQLKF